MTLKKSGNWVSSIMESAGNKYILITVDVEDWFQVENFKACIPFSSWPDYRLRVEKNTHIILDLLDRFSFNPKATFFFLGWIAEKLPHLVKEVHQRGHEVASHGSNHHLATAQDPVKFLKDLTDSRKLLEDLAGSPVQGFRAPSFAIDQDILDLIHKAGYRYDSSFNSFAMHGRYGQVILPEPEPFGIACQVQDDFYELPVSNLSIANKVFPLGGGGYFRLIPFPAFKQGMKTVLNQNNAFLFYTHPWEFDPDQPRVKNAPLSFKFRHYINLAKTRNKFLAMIKSFNTAEFITCSGYLNMYN